MRAVFGDDYDSDKVDGSPTFMGGFELGYRRVTRPGLGFVLAGGYGNFVTKPEGKSYQMA